MCDNTHVIRLRRLCDMTCSWQENLDEELQREIVHRVMRDEVAKLKQVCRPVFHINVAHIHIKTA